MRWLATVVKTPGLQVFPACRAWVRALFGSVRSPVQIRAPRFFPANRPLFALRFAVCWSPQKLNGTYHAKVRGPQKCCKSPRSTASVDTTGRIGEVHRTRTGALARKDLLIRMFSLRSSGTRPRSCAQSVPNPGERGRVKRRRALAVPEDDRQPRAGFRLHLGRDTRRRPGAVFRRRSLCRSGERAR